MILLIILYNEKFMNNVFNKLLLIISILLVSSIANSAFFKEGDAWYSGRQNSLLPDQGHRKSIDSKTAADARIEFLKSGNLVAYDYREFFVNNRAVKRAFFSSGAREVNNFGVSATLSKTGTIDTIIESDKNTLNPGSRTTKYSTMFQTYNESGVGASGLVSKIYFNSVNKPELSIIQSWSVPIVNYKKTFEEFNYDNYSKPIFDNFDVLLEPDQIIQKNTIVKSKTSRYSLKFDSNGRFTIYDGNEILLDEQLPTNISYLKLDKSLIYSGDTAPNPYRKGLSGYDYNNKFVELPFLNMSYNEKGKLLVANTPKGSVVFIGLEQKFPLKNIDLFEGYSSGYISNKGCTTFPVPSESYYFVAMSGKCEYRMF